MEKASMAAMVADFLRSEGYSPNVDKDYDITFKIEGKAYLIIPDPNDEMYFGILFPNFWPIESEAERAKVTISALKATADTKVAKIYPYKDNVIASIELFLSPYDSFKLVFNRSMSALRAAVTNFVNMMRE